MYQVAQKIPTEKSYFQQLCGIVYQNFLIYTGDAATILKFLNKLF